MFLSAMILDQWVDCEETTSLIEGAQQVGITVAGRLTGLILNEVVGRTGTF